MFLGVLTRSEILTTDSVCKMTMENVTPASGSLDPAVVVTDLQLRLLQAIKKSKLSLNYSFSSIKKLILWKMKYNVPKD